jgi:hypothetical protein
MQHLEGSGTPALYIGRTVLKGKFIIVTRHANDIHTVTETFWYRAAICDWTYLINLHLSVHYIST